MALEDIIGKILNDAKDKVSAAQKQTAEETQKLTQQIDEDISEEIEQINKTNQEKITQLKEQKKIIAQLDAQKDILKAKQEIIDEVFEKAASAFMDMDKSPYQSFIKDKLTPLIKTGSEKVVFDKRDKTRLDEAFLKGFKCEVSFAQDKNIQAGFIVEGDKFRIDNSIKALLNIIRPEIEAEAARILFE